MAWARTRNTPRSSWSQRRPRQCPSLALSPMLPERPLQSAKRCKLVERCDAETPSGAELLHRDDDDDSQLHLSQKQSLPASAALSARTLADIARSDRLVNVARHHNGVHYMPVPSNKNDAFDSMQTARNLPLSVLSTPK